MYGTSKEAHAPADIRAEPFSESGSVSCCNVASGLTAVIKEIFHVWDIDACTQLDEPIVA